MFIDSHAHITSNELFDDIDDILKRAKGAGVTKIVNICTDKTTLKRGLEVAKKHPVVLNAGATTPHDVEKEGEAYFSLFEEAALTRNLVAIGETGLDYYYEDSNRALQKEFLLRYFDLAMRANLPVIIHCRDAFDDLFAITKEFTNALLLHCFTGSLAEAKMALDRGCLISISGIATFKRSIALREVIQNVPLSSLVIETDSPYLAPQSKRGKRNEPSFLPETAQLIAELKGVSLEEVASTTSSTITKFLGI